MATLLATLAQPAVAAPGAADALLNAAMLTLGGAVVGLAVWIARVVLGTRDDVRSIRQTLTGADGGNGLVSRVGQTERAQQLQDKVLALHEGRLDRLEGAA